MMETVKSFKGYGKVDPTEDQSFQRNTRKRMIIISLSVIVLASLVVAAMVGIVVRNNHDEGKGNSSSSPSTSLDSSIKAVCSVTHYPDSCFSYLSSTATQATSNPKQLFKLSMEASMKEVSKLSTLPDKLAAQTNDERNKAAILDCGSLYDETIDHLNTSISSIQSGESSTGSIIADLKSWLSAALTNLQTCLDGLEETNSTALTEVRSAMKNPTELTSNSLAIVSKILSVLQDMDLTIHHHRKLLEFPEWVVPAERKLLQEQAGVVVGAREPNVTVAKDGTGNFTTIREAVATVPMKNVFKYLIYVKEGTYEENVMINKTMWNVMMYGDGKTKTIITGNRSFIGGTPTFATATLVAVGKGFFMKDMGIRNTAGPENHQAVAMRSGSDLSVFYNCSFDAFQDTLYAHSNRQFYRDCDITGTIDFIFGNAASLFQGCNIMPRQPMANQFNTITAQGRFDDNQETGISIQFSNIYPLDNVTAHTYLGRPWKNHSTTIVMQSNIASIVDPTGWTPWLPGIIPPSTIFYAEYSNTGPGSALDKRVTWEGYRSNITEVEASKFTVATFLRGSEWLPQTTVAYNASLQ